MARTVVWTEEASGDLLAAVSYIARDSPTYARRLARLALDAADSLRTLPERGRPVTDAGEGRFRELIVGSYRLMYLVTPEKVVVHGFIHGARSIEGLL